MDNFYNDKSLFRFSIIAPIINNTHGFASINEYISFAANKTYTFDNKDYRFSKSCIKNWYLSYKKNGISALQVKSRNDKNSSRRLNYETISKIQELRVEFPNITGTAIYKNLIKDNYIDKSKVSLSTILRFIKKNNLKAGQICNIERRMFEMDCVNACCYTNLFKIPTFMIDSFVL